MQPTIRSQRLLPAITWVSGGVAPEGVGRFYNPGRVVLEAHIE